jgi:hypothetical protein
MLPIKNRVHQRVVGVDVFSVPAGIFWLGNQQPYLGVPDASCVLVFRLCIIESITFFIEKS